MGQSVPTFQEGDRVRIMQTNDAYECGVAGLTGIVVRQSNHGVCLVKLDGDNGSRTWPNHGLSCCSHVKTSPATREA